ncbi:MAG: hypothetical protein PSV35_04170 [bacterium]|nr:hypothetical protein [bacterium]
MTPLNQDHLINRNNEKSHVAEAANELLNESKKLAHELYEEGLNKLNTAEEQVKQYSDHMLLKVQKKPLTSVLMAIGLGFILAKILK